MFVRQKTVTALTLGEFGDISHQSVVLPSLCFRQLGESP